MQGQCEDHRTVVPICSAVCCTLPSVSTTIKVCRTEASNQGGMAIYQHNVLDCLNTISIGGGGCQDLGEFLIIYACIRQNAPWTNRVLSFLIGYCTPALFDVSDFNQQRAALSSHDNNSDTHSAMHEGLR